MVGAPDNPCAFCLNLVDLQFLPTGIYQLQNSIIKRLDVKVCLSCQIKTTQKLLFMKPINMLILASLIILSSCKKDPVKEESSTPVTDSTKFSRDALAYVQLTPGKYFIYKDSATSSQDSVVVTMSLLNTVYFQASSDAFFRYNAHTQEKFNLVLTKFTDSVQVEWFNGNADAFCDGLGINNNCNSAAVNLMEGGLFAFEGFVYSYPINLSVAIEGKMYHDVIIHDSWTPTVDINDPHYVHNIYYWAKGVGIIKRTNITTGGAVKTYTLLRNN
jgi:hypothetical protein